MTECKITICNNENIVKGYEIRNNKEIFFIDKKCYGSCPCQHNVYIFDLEKNLIESEIMDQVYILNNIINLNNINIIDDIDCFDGPQCIVSDSGSDCESVSSCESEWS